MRDSRKSFKYRRETAFLMAALICSMSICVPSYASAPSVSVDETMYVNLDYYGAKTRVNVVKGCSTNGVTAYTDYGDYEKVVNMSDKTEPVLGDGTVTWQLPAENRRFYFQCTLPMEQAALPWDFDISYKLNGVETEAAKLAGASGLVEINIKAEPVQNTLQYYRDNMLLSVVVPVDMETCYSVEAPGAQLQSAGSSTAAIFAALPGEEGDYTVRIGTDSFESVGVLMMMTPGTLDALKDIKDFKEAKDTWREDGNQMYDSMNELMKTVESMKTDVTEVKGGLSSLEDARGQAGSRRKAIEALSTEALADLKSVTDQTVELIPYLETAQRAVTDINANVTAISSTLGDTQDELDKLYDRLGSLRRSLESMSQTIGSGVSAQEQQKIAEEITQKTGELEEILGELGEMSGNSRGLYDSANEDLEAFGESIEKTGSFEYGRKGPSGLPGSGGETDEDFDVWSDEDIEEDADAAEDALRALSGTGYQSSVGDLLSELQSLIGSEEEITQTAGALIKRVNEVSASVGSASHQTAQTVSALRGVTDELVNLMDDSRVLMDTLDSYVPSLLDSLGATEELMNRLTKAMGSTHDMLSLVNETFIAAGDSLDEGTKDTLDGMMKMLDKSLKTLDATTGVRTAGESMKGTVDEQLDKLEAENQFLNMDPEAGMVSFTSAQNPSPHSLQIIVRTDEISLDSDGDAIMDMEVSADEVQLSPLARMWRVLVEIFESIVSIFKNR